MIANHFKKYTTTLLFPCIFNVFIYFPATYCMHMEQNCKSLKTYAKTFVSSIIPYTTTLCYSTLLFQLSNVNGYTPDTQAACYEACAHNCSADVNHRMCDITFDTIGVPLTLIGSCFYLIGVCAGYCIKSHNNNNYN